MRKQTAKASEAATKAREEQELALETEMKEAEAEVAAAAAEEAKARKALLEQRKLHKERLELLRAAAQRTAVRQLLSPTPTLARSRPTQPRWWCSHL